MTTTPQANAVFKETTAVYAKGYSPSSPKSPTTLPPDGAAALPPSLPDLAALPDDAISTIVAEGQAELARRAEKKAADFLDLVATTARTLGLGRARVAAAIAAKSPRKHSISSDDQRHHVKAVYRDPVSDATWSGRGKAPPFIEFGDETLPPKKPGDEPRRLPLRKFWIAEQGK